MGTPGDPDCRARTGDPPQYPRSGGHRRGPAFLTALTLLAPAQRRPGPASLDWLHERPLRIRPLAGVECPRDARPLAGVRPSVSPPPHGLRRLPLQPVRPAPPRPPGAPAPPPRLPPGH